jgi:hypothetical protein
VGCTRSLNDYVAQGPCEIRVGIWLGLLLWKGQDDLNGVVVSNADCYSKGSGFESRVSHGPFQKVKHWIDNPSCKK